MIKIEIEEGCDLDPIYSEAINRLIASWLACKLDRLPEADQLEVFKLKLKLPRLNVLEMLAWSLHNLPEENQLETFNKLLGTQVPDVLRALAYQIKYLPKAHQAEARTLFKQKRKELKL